MSLETTKTLSGKINVPQYTIREWVKERIIPAYQVGRKYFFDLNEVEGAIKKNKLH